MRTITGRKSATTNAHSFCSQNLILSKSKLHLQKVIERRVWEHRIDLPFVICRVAVLLLLGSLLACRKDSRPHTVTLTWEASPIPRTTTT
jgi:hypothetical protein